MQARAYYVPKSAIELRLWFKVNRPEWRVGSWTKARLYAVYFAEMDKHFDRG